MEETDRPAPRRRTLLQRGLALLGGALGVGAIGHEVGADSRNAAPGRTLRLLGRRRPSAQVARGPRPAASRVVSSGELLADGGGETVGSYHTSGFCAASPLGPPLPAASDIAFQTFILEEGTLFGLGPGAPAGGERTCAVLGGTGRFAGVRGSYVERAPSAGAVGRNTVEFIFTLNA